MGCGVQILHPYLRTLKRPPTRIRDGGHREPVERRSCPSPVGQRGLAARSESSRSSKRRGRPFVAAGHVFRHAKTALPPVTPCLSRRGLTAILGGIGDLCRSPRTGAIQSVSAADTEGILAPHRSIGPDFSSSTPRPTHRAAAH